jgi:hypothetical protein
MNLRDWSDDEVRRTAAALERLPAADLARADALLATVPGLAQQLTGTLRAPPEPAPLAGPAGLPGCPETSPPRAWEFARWLYQHGRLSDEVP